MTSLHVRAARRNAGVLGATVVTVGMLFLFPTSTDRVGPRRSASGGAPAGLVTPAVPPSSGAVPTRTINGTAFDTRYGPVQVQITIRSGRVVTATAITYPRGSGRDREINSYAIPVLERETVQAQSARIDTVSGATYTSDGYVRSLQAALDSAHLG
jgi:uncharacterized protein with FMN-binding domain